MVRRFTGVARHSQDIKYMCETKCGMPHTINLCRHCHNLGLAERNESKVTNARWKTMIEQKVSRGNLSAAFRADGFVERM